MKSRIQCLNYRRINTEIASANSKRIISDQKVVKEIVLNR